jgi:hypothetical protein
MATTYEPIATNTVSGSSTSVITFSSISGSYTDLRLVMASQNADAYCVMRLNGDSTSLYSRTTLQGNGTTASSGRGSNETSWFPSVGNATVTANGTVDINNYSNATTYKTALTRFNLSFDAVVAQAWLYRSTSAITSITLTVPSTNNWIAGSTFTLYGIKSA